MKKIITLILAFTLIFTLTFSAGCSFIDKYFNNNGDNSSTDSNVGDSNEVDALTGEVGFEIISGDDTHRR